MREILKPDQLSKLMMMMSMKDGMGCCKGGMGGPGRPGCPMMGGPGCPKMDHPKDGCMMPGPGPDDPDPMEGPGDM